MTVTLPSWLQQQIDKIPRPAVYSVVIPVYNEEENIEPLLNELVPVMNDLSIPYEIICIDDGSGDSTGEILSGLTGRIPSLRVIRFEKNTGQSAAFLAGFRTARGRWIITMDADLQNDPADIPRMLEALAGHDAVLGVREKRQDSFVRKCSSRIANYTRRLFTGDSASDTGCSLKIFPREFSLTVPGFKGVHRFYATLLQWAHLDITELPVNHRPRKLGTSKYNIRNRLFRALSDMFAMLWMRKRKISYRIAEELPDDKK